MKSEHLFEAVGLVDDRLVEEAAGAHRAASPWGRWLATAACLLLVLGLGGVAAGTLLRGCGTGQSAAPAAEMDEAAADAAPSPAAAESAPAEPAAAPAAEPSPEAASGETFEEEAAASEPAPPPEPETASGGMSAEPSKEETAVSEPTAMPAPASGKTWEDLESGFEPTSESPAEAAPSDGGENGLDATGAAAYEIRALTVEDGADLSARRALRLEADGAETEIIDRYELSAGTGRETAARLLYPLGSQDGTALRVYVDGAPYELPGAGNAFDLTIPAQGALTLEISCTAPTGGFALLPESGLSMTEQTVQVLLDGGWTLETDLPGDPSSAPVAFDAARARWTIRLAEAGADTSPAE